MKAFVLLVLVAAAWAATPPTVSGSFSSKYVTKYATHGRNDTVVGTIYEDIAGQRQRDDTQYQGNSLSIISFHQHENQTAYIYVINRAVCNHHHVDGPLYNRWQWVANSTSTGSCTVGTTSGQQWSFARGEAQIVGCFSGNTPLQVTFTTHQNTETTTFSGYQGSTPDPSVFQLNSACFSN
eukprot:TRINITY_DN33_c0_g1_i1.p2 TRINITY_DN33_c0_g1~~TRINITY_DN33_c0_g1_i1.p2  ORF type:complete len:201 (+),score=52.37 TRINITY_DN33_c0_g1_i1:61-603(+)